MKYLMRFNESSSDDYYQRIPFDNDIDHFFSSTFTGPLKKVPFETKYFDDIKRRLNNEIFSIYPQTIRNTICITNKLKLDISNYEIGQADDDWFYIEKRNSRTITYYKCDQFDGLIKFLEDNNVIN